MLLSQFAIGITICALTVIKKGKFSLMVLPLFRNRCHLRIHAVKPSNPNSLIYTKNIKVSYVNKILAIFFYEILLYVVIFSICFYGYIIRKGKINYMHWTMPMS